MINEGKFLFSIEMFPPKESSGLDSIIGAIPLFASLKPDYISVTYGAGGGNKNNSEYIAAKVKEYGINSVAHLTCCGATKESIGSQLVDLKAHGVTDILALRGDLKEGKIQLTDFKHATDLIEYINGVGGFTMSAACYPEGHSESADYAQDIEVLKMKADLGIKRFVSQLFYDNADFYLMRDAMDKAGIKATVQAGIMPMTNVKQILRIVQLSGAKIPAKLAKIVARFENNPAAFRQAGLNYGLEQITDLIANGVDGVHIYSMNLPAVSTYIYNGISHLVKEAKA